MRLDMQALVVQGSRGAIDPLLISPPASNRLKRTNALVTVMLDAANYSAIETLRDARRFEIRAFRPDDRTDFLSAGPASVPCPSIVGSSLKARLYGERKGILPKC